MEGSSQMKDLEQMKFSLEIELSHEIFVSAQ